MLQSNAMLIYQTHFDAAHVLPDHPGKCSSMHGHTYKVDLAVYGPIDEKTGMVVDFGVLKMALQKTLKLLDHQHLNDSLAFADGSLPTAENIARFVGDYIIRQEFLPKDVKVLYVTIWEGPGKGAKVWNNST